METTETDTTVQAGPRVADLQLDGGEQTAAERFAANRRYDHRPAIENIDRPTLVLTTRTAPSEPSGTVYSPFLLAACAIVCVLLGGVVLGWLRSSGGASESTPELAVAEAVSVAGAGIGQNEPPSEAAAAAPDPVRAETGEPTPHVESHAAPEHALSAQIADLNLDRVTFVPGEAILTPGALVELGRLAEVLQEHPTEPVDVRVRTYSESTPGRNHGLSVLQANAIAAALVGASVEADRVSVIGLGSEGTERPRASAALFLDVAGGQPVEPLIFDTPVSGSLSDSSHQTLEAAAIAVGDAEISLVGYAWSEPNESANHDASHALVDQVAEVLMAAGLRDSQIERVGLGSTSVPIADRSTELTIEVGARAAIAVELGGLSLEAVSFVQGGTTLTPQATASLDRVVAALRRSPEARIGIDVHFYGTSDSQTNHDLSRLQATSIESYLMDHGIDEGRVRLAAHGDPPHFEHADRDSVVTLTVLG